MDAPKSIPDNEQVLMDRLIAEHGISPDLVNRLLYLVTHEHADLNLWGAKSALQREIKESVEKAVTQADATEAKP